MLCALLQLLHTVLGGGRDMARGVAHQLVFDGTHDALRAPVDARRERLSFAAVAELMRRFFGVHVRRRAAQFLELLDGLNTVTH